MVIRILEHSTSSATPLAYNESKCAEGVAKIVGVGNIHDDSIYSVRSSLLQAESNPAISARTRKKGFHLCINPGPDDTIDEAGVLELAKDVMDGLGFGGQPYAIYRHHDIERVHYHVVSTRVDGNGKIIRDSFSHRRLQKMMERLGKKYGFVVGLSDDNDIVQPAVLVKGMKDMLRQMRSNVEFAFSLAPKDEEEFRRIIRTFGMDLCRGTLIGKDGTEHPFVSFRGRAQDGKFISRPIPAKRILGENYKVRLEEIEGKRYVVGHDSKIKSLLERILQTMQSATSTQDFRTRLRREKIGIFFFDSKMNRTETRSNISMALVIDFRNQCCLTLDAGLLARILTLDEAASKKKKAANTEKRPAVSPYSHKIH